MLKTFSAAMDIQDVARRARVSVATVSRVFNQPRLVMEATRLRVEAAAHELGYVPNASARTLRTSRSRVLGVVLPTLTNPVFAECLEGIAHAASTAGYAIVPMTTGYDAAQELRAVNLLMAGNADAQLLVVSDPSDSAGLRKLRDAGVPYVLIYNRHPDHACVSVQSEQAVADLVARLVALGHRSLAMVSGQFSASDRARQRHEGFVRGVQQAGVTGRLLEVPFMESAVDELAVLLRRPDRPTALVCSNDLLALRAIRAASLAGLRVPHDISVAGFDGIAIGRDTMPSLTTVAQPNDEMGRAAVELLVRAMANGTPLTPQASHVFPYEITVGESCGLAPSLPPRRIRKALSSPTSPGDR